MQKIVIKKKTYRDSVNLMMLANQIGDIRGINDVAILMGSPANKQRLHAAGYNDPELDNAHPDDLCIGLIVDSEIAFKEALSEIEKFISGKSQTKKLSSGAYTRVNPKTIRSALKMLPDAELISISLPGEYAAREARKALELGLHVFLFSDNVSFEDEVQLKNLAQNQGLFLMGPDCGTAQIGQTPLGFCNLVPTGNIGIVAASGTGAQEVMSIIAEEGEGISHIIGTGGHDLDRRIGGLTFSEGIKALARDDNTHVIVLISKPPDEMLEEKIIDLAKGTGKPTVISFIGLRDRRSDSSNIVFAENLDHAARTAIALLNRIEVPYSLSLNEFLEQYREKLQNARNQLSARRRYIRGLYSGGTLANEAALILSDTIPDVRAGQGFASVKPIEDWDHSVGNMVIDFGESRFTQGQPHPMIDTRVRVQRLKSESDDPSVAVIMLDVVLGLNAHSNPASQLVPTISTIQDKLLQSDDYITFIVHVCGTEQDPQNLDDQIEQFEAIGCLVFRSNVQAALAAAWIVAEQY